MLPAPALDAQSAISPEACYTSDWYEQWGGLVAAASALEDFAEARSVNAPLKALLNKLSRLDLAISGIHKLQASGGHEPLQHAIVRAVAACDISVEQLNHAHSPLLDGLWKLSTGRDPDGVTACRLCLPAVSSGAWIFRLLCPKQYVSTVKYLSDHQLLPVSCLREAFMVAFASNSADLATLLLQRMRSALDSNEVPPESLDILIVQAMSSACERGHVTMLALLVEQHVPLPSDGIQRSLTVAAANGHLAVLQFLITRVIPMPVTSSPYTPQIREAMSLAIRNGHSAVVSWLFDLAGQMFEHSDMIDDAILSLRPRMFDLVCMLVPVAPSGYLQEQALTRALQRADQSFALHVLSRYEQKTLESLQSTGGHEAKNGLHQPGGLAMPEWTCRAACQRPNIVTLQRLLQYDVITLHGQWHEALIQAVLGKQYDCVEFLLAHGANPRVQHDTPLCVAAAGNDARMVSLLLTAMESSIHDRSGVDAYRAVFAKPGGCLRLVKLLLTGLRPGESVADLDMCEHAVQAMLLSQHLEALEWVCEHISQLLLAFVYRLRRHISGEGVWRILLRHPDMPFFSRPDVVFARVFELGDAPVLELALRTFKAPTVADFMPQGLVSFAMSGNDACLTILLEYERGLHVQLLCAAWGTAIYAAACCGHHSTCTLLLNAMISVGYTGHTALMKQVLPDLRLSLEQRDLVWMAALIREHGLLSRAQQDHTMLMHAAQSGHLPMVTLLISRGADVQVSNDTPLRSAAERGHTAVIRLLLDSGADAATLESSIMGYSPEVQRLLGF